MASLKEIAKEIIGNIDKDKLSSFNINIDIIKEEIKTMSQTEGLKDKNNLQCFYEIWKKNTGKTGDQNKINSWTAYLLGMTTKKPDGEFLPSRRVFARAGFPDIDVDFDDERRDDIYNYIIEKYGRENVGNIGTSLTLKSKSAVRRLIKALDCANAFSKGKDKYVSENEALAKEISETLKENNLGIIPVQDENGKTVEVRTIREAYRYVPDFRHYLDKYPEILQHADDFQGLNVISSRHAAGVVISNTPLSAIAPLRLSKDALITQFPYEDLEYIGLIKFDILAIASLTVIRRCVEMIKINYNIDIDISKIPIDDKNTFDLYKSGNLNGVFQCEQRGMQQVMKDIEVDRFDDVVAAIALYRPGPMDSIPDYVGRKKGSIKIEYFHPTIEKHVKPCLENTYGVLVFQEQLMAICNVLAGFTIAEGYIMIKAVGKKKQDLLNNYKKKFVNGCVRNDVPESVADAYWEKFITPFAHYGFNKCFSGKCTLTEAQTGEMLTIKEVVERIESGKNIYVHSLDKNSKLTIRKITNVYRNGKKIIYNLKLRNGNILKVTSNHKIKTSRGMLQLKNIKVGDYVATPKHIAVHKAQGKIHRTELKTLAHLIAEGNTCHPTTLYFYNNDIELVNDFCDGIENFFERTISTISRRSDGRYEVAINTARKNKIAWNKVIKKKDYKAYKPRGMGNLSGAYKWAVKLGLIYKKATEKFIPDYVFTLPDEDIMFFIGRLWSGDGSIVGKRLKNVGSSNPYVGSSNPYYATSSKQLAYQVSLLLLRIGIVSKVSIKRLKYKGGYKTGYVIYIYDKNSLRVFIEDIIPHIVGRQKDIIFLKEYYKTVSANPSQNDVIPADFFSLIRKEIYKKYKTLASASTKAGINARTFSSLSPYKGRGIKTKGIKFEKHSFYRDTVTKLAKGIDSEPLKDLVNSDIMWVRVVDISKSGKEETFDITVEEDHNLIVDGVVVSNSHSEAYGFLGYQTAYLKANFPEEFVISFINTFANRANWDHVDMMDVEARKRMGIYVLPRQLNHCEVEWKIVRKRDMNAGISQSEIRPGVLSKGIGLAAAEEIVKNKPYKGLRELAEKTNKTIVDSRAVAALLDNGFLGGKKDEDEKQKIVNQFAAIRKDMTAMAKKGIKIVDLFE